MNISPQNGATLAAIVTARTRFPRSASLDKDIEQHDFFFPQKHRHLTWDVSQQAISDIFNANSEFLSVRGEEQRRNAAVVTACRDVVAGCLVPLCTRSTSTLRRVRTGCGCETGWWRKSARPPRRQWRRQRGAGSLRPPPLWKWWNPAVKKKSYRQQLLLFAPVFPRATITKRDVHSSGRHSQYSDHLHCRLRRSSCA